MRDTRRRRVVLVVLLLVSLTLIALGGGSSGPGKALRSAAGAVFGPVQRAVAAAWQPVHDFFGGLGEGDQARLDQLQKENDRLRLQERTNEYDHSRADELDALLRVASLGQYTIVPAQVIGVTPAQGFSNTVLIDAGSKDGLKAGMTVINGDGLVGRVKAVTGSTATVLLAIDPDYKVGVRLATTLDLGYVSGNGSNQPLTYSPFQNSQAMTPGSVAVTWQQPQLSIPGGIPIGTILSNQGAVGSTRSATVKPFVDFDSLDLVGVVVVLPRTDPRDRVVPSPLPRPTPTASAGASAGSTAGTTKSGSPRPNPSASHS
jgi:rod shape-determining protein MreC